MKNVLISFRDYIGKRHLISALLCFAYISSYFSRGNIAVSIVAMTSKNGSSPNAEAFDWDDNAKNAVLSSYFAGFIVSSIAAGEVIRLAGAPAVLYGSFIAHALLSAVSPLSASLGGWLALCLIRALIGLTHGFLDPLVFYISSKWFPPNDRNSLLNICFSGTPVGIALAFQVSGFIAQGPLGWPSIFYFSSLMLLLFCVLWKIFGEWSPHDCKNITPEEKLYIETALSTVKEGKVSRTPWAKILSSPPVYAILATGFAQGILTTINGSEAVLLIDAMHDISVSMLGLITSVPIYFVIILININGKTADVILTRKILSPVTLRKISAAIALTLNAVFLLLMGFLGFSLPAIITLLFLSFVCLSFAYIGFLTNPLDLSINHSQSIVGLARATENVASFLTPLAFSWLLTDTKSLASWRMSLSAVLAPAFLCSLLFLIFGQAEIQLWDNDGVDEQESNS